MKKEKTKVAAVKKEEDVIKETIAAFLQTLGVEGTTKVVVSEEIIDVVLETQDSGIVIGHHGEVLEALQIIMSALVSKKIGRFIRVSIEIGEYKKNRQEWLESLAQTTKERVLENQQEISLPGLKSWERRLVHMFLKDDTEVTSESIGEGKERTLVVKPRS